MIENIGTTEPTLDIGTQEPPAPQEHLIDIGPSDLNTSNAVPADVAASRADKYHYALGASSPGKDVMQSEIASGFDNITREKAMNVERANIEHARQTDLRAFVDRAKQDGRPLDQGDYETLSSLTGPVVHSLLISPDTYFEKKQATRVIQEALPSNTKETPTAPTEDQKLGLNDYLTKQYSFQKLLEETDSRYSNESVLSHAASTVKDFSQIYGWWNTKDLVSGAPTSSTLQGSNILEQVQYLNTLPPEEALLKAREAVDKLYEQDPGLARSFAEAIVSYGESDKFVSNLTNVAAVGTGFTATALGKGLGKVAKIAASRGSTIPAVLDASGQVADAALRTTLKRISEAADRSGARSGSFSELGNQVPSITNPAATLANKGATPFSHEFATRLQTELTNNSEALLNSGVNINNITRLSPGTAAYDAGIQETKDLFRLQYPGVNNAVINTEVINSADNLLTNTDHIAVHLGKNDSTLFDSAVEASNAAKYWGMQGHTIEPRGDKFTIRVTKAIDETTPTVRNALRIDTIAEPTPNPVLGKFLGFFRTKDALLPTSLNLEVKTTTFGSEQVSGISKAIMQRAYEDLPSRLRSTSRKDLVGFLEHQRDVPNPRTPGTRGTFSSDLGEFTNDWRQVYNRPPTEAEARAYFTYTQVSDAEYVTRNLNIYKGKSRLGLENFHFAKDGVTFKTPPSIEGRIKTVEDIFSHKDDAGVLVWDKKQGSDPLYYRKNSTLGSKDREALHLLQDTQGYRAIQISPVGEEALRQFPGVKFPTGRIHYVLVPKYESSPLALRQIPYRPGGHVVYADNHFISQPIVSKHTYRGATVHEYGGDNTVMAFRTSAQAKKFYPSFNQGRELLAKGDKKGLITFLQGKTHGLPYSYQEFTRLFDKARGGIFDVNTPFYPRTGGKNVAAEHKLDSVYENFQNPSSSAHNVFNEDVNLQFTQAKGEQLSTIINLGSDTHPHFNAVPSRLVDPTTTLGRSVTQATKGRYLEDLKIKSAERFVQEFKTVFKGSLEELQRFPLKTLLGDNIDKAHPNQTLVAAATNYRRAMKELFNAKSDEMHRVNSIVNGIAERAIGALGEVRGGRLLDTLEPYLASTITDPTRFFRSVTYHTRMGFWNPKQLFLQAQGVATTQALEGVDRATRGGALGALMRPLHMRGNDAILDHAASLAGNFGMKPSHFKESYLALQRSGFQNVGGEFGVLDDVLNPNILRSGASRVLDNSMFLFKAGERVNRLTAWNAAYLRWRDENPLGLFDNQAQKQVLNRADMLTLNMTRASNAGYQTGWSAVPFQFFGFNGKLMDLMVGGRIPFADKARIMRTYSLLYGVPLGVLGTTAGALYPWHEAARKQLIDSGVDVSDTGWKLFTDGVVQTAISAATHGEVDPSFAETYGPNGSTLLKDIFTHGNKSTAEILGGPALQTTKAIATVSTKLMSSTWEHMKQGYGMKEEPYTYSLLAMASDDKNVYPLTVEDLTPLLDNITSASNLKKAYYAYTMGRYMSKNDVKIIDSDIGNPLNAFFISVFGAGPQSVLDHYSKIDILRGTKEAQRESEDEAIKYIRFSQNPEISDSDRLDYMKRAHHVMNVLGGFTEQQKFAIIRKATGSGLSEIEQIDNRLKSRDADSINKYLEKVSK